jgi:transcriptional regulator with XRE-family HTH domain
MDKIKDFSQRNPVVLAHETGQRLMRLRLAKGWTREELAERSGIAVSTLKLLESKGQGSFQRLVRVVVTLGADGELRGLFAGSGEMESIDAVKLAQRQRAPRRRKDGGEGGA